MNYNITPKEFLDKVTNIKPTSNIYIDIYAVKHFGEYMYNIINYQKWKLCNTLENDIFKSITELYPLSMTELSQITQILKDGKDNNIEPNYTKTTIDKYIIDQYCNKYDINRNHIDDINKGKLYLEFSTALHTQLNAIYKKYETDWETIENSYECVSDKIEELYDYLEKSEEFVKVEEEMENITSIVDNKIITRYNEFENVDQLKYEIELCFMDIMNELDIKEDIKNLIKNTIIPVNISFHKLNFSMKRGQDMLVNTISNFYN